LIIPPDTCPSCDSTLVWVKDQLFCKNNSCDAKSSKQVEHFAKTLKIKGLGPSTIEKLELSGIIEIYELTLDYMTLILGSEKTATKVFEEIKRSKCEPLNLLLPAFGIPLVGKSATDKLAEEATHICDIDLAACKRAGLGPKVTENLLNWIEDQLPKYIDLSFSWEFSKETKTAGEAGVVCITGKLKSYPTKAAAKAILESLGYKVKDSITKDVTILVNESGVETAKTLKAANDGVQIVNNLKELIGE